MKTLFTVVAVIAFVSLSLGAEPNPRGLDPSNPDDRATLVEIIKRSANGKSNQAAKRLAEAGYMEELLHILSSTTSYNTMQAIAQTRDERTIPVFESRLRREPNHRYLVGSLAYVQSPRASPILIELLERHADAERPSDQDMVGCLLNAIVFNRCQDAIPLLRERLAACGAASQANRKSNYALTLLSLGDPVGMPWLSKKIGEDIDVKVVHSWTADRLATLCDWQRSRFDIVRIQDETIMTPLLPVLVRGASSSDCPFARECVRVLRVLTRHDFPEGDTAWQDWYSKHAARHPVYSKPLDRSAQLCMTTFRKRLAERAKTDETIKWVDHFLGQPQNGWGSHNDVLWKLHSRPERAAGMPFSENLPPREKWKDYGLSFTVGLTSRLKEPEHVLMRQDFNAINLTVCLASPTEDKHIRECLTAMAKETCVILSKYESFYTSGQDAEQDKSSVRGKPHR